jgi:predicted nuclease of restriction endonuclease-like RecB superfamily
MSFMSSLREIITQHKGWDMKASVRHECDDLISDINDFVTEVLREHGEDKAREFVDHLLERIGELPADDEFEEVAQGTQPATVIIVRCETEELDV